jgi:hypothetical protein
VTSSGIHDLLSRGSLTRVKVTWLMFVVVAKE